MTKTKLPNKPSALIRLAIKDLEACEKDESYNINMDRWQMPLSNGICEVCLAGSVMAKTLGVPRTLESTAAFTSLDMPTMNKMWALDYFRKGNLYGGLISLKLPIARWKLQVEVPEYTPKTAKKFKKEMLEMAQQFEDGGL